MPKPGIGFPGCTHSSLRGSLSIPGPRPGFRHGTRSSILPSALLTPTIGHS
ncbi:Hypothetical predicted protein, partial [Marmota monax]